MKRIFCGMLMLCLMISNAWADVEINDANFPDDVFRAYVATFDTNSNGWLSNSEIAAVKEINHYYIKDNIVSLQGIEYFTELTYLNLAYNYELLSIDVSKNTMLNRLDIHNNKVASIDVSKNTMLTYLNVSNNQLKEIDVSSNKKLEHLYCDGNHITELNIRNNTRLEALYCSENMLTELDVKPLTQLTHLSCHSNLLQELDIKNNSKLIYVFCDNNLLTELDLSNNLQLSTLSCSSNMLAELRVSHLAYLQNFYCTSNMLTELDVKSNTKLEWFDCSYNQLSDIDVSANTALEVFHFERNRLTMIDLSNNLSLDLFGDTTEQIVPALVLTKKEIRPVPDEKEYINVLNFSDYIPSSKIPNIIDSSVQGIDENNEPINTKYSNGIAEFEIQPERVLYSYNTGLDDISMDVKIGTASYMTVSFNNHVYRLFPQRRGWQSARQYCEAIGGHLATVNSDEEQKVLDDLATKAYQERDYTIRYVYIGAELDNGVWKWIVDGEDFDRTVDSQVPSGRYLSLAADPRYTNYIHYYSPMLSVMLGFICEWEPYEADYAALLSEDIITPDDFSGYIQNPRDLSHLIDNPPTGDVNIVYKPKYDPREEGINLPPVRNQGNYGTCWSFSSIGALEISYMKRFGETPPDLSELHQAWYVFRDPRESYRKNLFNASNMVLNQGGWSSLSVAFLSGIGPAREAAFPYEEAGTDAKVEAFVNSSQTRYPENYYHPMILRNAYELGKITSENRDKMRNVIKSFINGYGAVLTSYRTNSKNPGFNDDNTNYYLPNTSQSTGGHAVIIIGWDDNYSRTNFKNTPEIDGAWLIKNSWGKGWGDNGYFWLSYANELDETSVYIAGKNSNMKNYGRGAKPAIYTINNIWSANMFKSTGNEAIRDIAFYTRDNNVPYEIYINKHGEEKPANPGTPAALVASGTMTYEGYHTITLSNPVSIQAGEYFSVIVKLSKASSPYVTAIEDDSSTTSNVNIAGKSYFSLGEDAPSALSWKDGGTLEIAGVGSAGACIRAFTSPSNYSLGDVRITTETLASGTVDEYYSYALKASGAGDITWSASGLPEGFGLNGNIINGKTSRAKLYSVILTATNGITEDTVVLELMIDDTSSQTSDAPQITTTSLPPGTVGEYYSATLKASGTGTITFTVSGLPDTLSLDHAVISGIPSIAQDYNLDIEASSTYGTDKKTLTLKINDAVTKPSSEDIPSGGGGGGCNSGLIGMSMLMLSAAVFFFKHNR